MAFLRGSFWLVYGVASLCTNTFHVGCSLKAFVFALVSEYHNKLEEKSKNHSYFPVTGITFKGVDENGKADWTGCSNIKLMVFENTKRFQHYIDSFNVQTNHWIAEYAFKRLRFLGNRTYSQLGALAFLALWHGFHSGYYMCFAMEFLVMVFEREVRYIETMSAAFIPI